MRLFIIIRFIQNSTELLTHAAPLCFKGASREELKQVFFVFRLQFHPLKKN